MICTSNHIEELFPDLSMSVYIGKIYNIIKNIYFTYWYLNIIIRLKG